jgi:hypothetical protein
METTEQQQNTTLSITMRPRTFDDVIGLQAQINAIRNKIAEGVPRGFLLKGQYGCGKTTLAYIIAREIQGWDFPADMPPQVQEINAANTRKLDDMRALALKSNAFPMVGKYNVIILDEVHQLTKDAQQVLLKELERVTAPTIWILATTDPEKLNSGVRDRCYTITVEGMNKAQRAELLARAAKETDHDGDYGDFTAALDKSRITSPRKILMAWELYHNGLSAQQAVGAMHFEALPEFFEVAMGTVFGQWDKGYSLPWIKDKAGNAKQFKAVCEQIIALDESLKKKAKAELEAAEADAAAAPTAPVDDEVVAADSAVEEEDMQGKPEVARALRAIVAALLKNQIAKKADKFNAAKAMKAATAMFQLAHCTSPNPFDVGMEWALTIGGLYKVNQAMQGK